MEVKAKYGLTYQQTAERFCIGKDTLTSWHKCLEPKLTKDRPSIKLDILKLQQDVEKYPQGASRLIKYFGTSKSAKIESLPSAVYSFGRHGSLSSRLRRLLRIFSAILLLYASTANIIASSTDLIWLLRHVARWE